MEAAAEKSWSATVLDLQAWTYYNLYQTISWGNLLSDLHVPHEHWVLDRHFWCLFCLLFTGIRHLAHVLTVPPTKAWLLCATPAGMDWYTEALPVGTYRVQSPGFPKIVYSHIQCLVYDVDKGLIVLFSMNVSTGQSWVGTRRRSYWTNWPGELQVTAECRLFSFAAKFWFLPSP